MNDLWIQPTGGALGADVHGIDLSRPIDDVQFKSIVAAWAEHLVLRFPGQRIDDHMLMRFSARFGELDRVPIASAAVERGDSGVPDDVREWVAVISSLVKDGKPVGGLGNYELVWHTDMSYNPLPPRASLLYALEVPPAGGDTGFLNMYAAYGTLPPDLKRAIEGHTCIHDSSRNSAGELRRGFQQTFDVRLTPGAVHPLVRLHPVTGRKALFLGRRPAPTSTGCRSMKARHCSTPSGRTLRRSASRGIRSGGRVIWCSGTIAASCIAATVSTKACAG